MKSRLFAARLAILPALLAIPFAVPAQALAPSLTRVSVVPASATMPLCRTATVAIQVSGVRDLYGFDVTLRFDPGVLSVERIEGGSFLDSGYSLQTVDNAAGSAEVAMTQLNPSLPKSGGGTLFSVAFRPRLMGASTPLTLSAALSQRDGMPISATLASGRATVVAADPATAIALRGRVADTVSGLPVPGAHITLTDTASAVYTATSGADGGYEFECGPNLALAAGSATVTADAPGYAPMPGYDPATAIADGPTVRNIPLAAQPFDIYPLYFRAERVSGHDVGLGWATAWETDTTGFNLYRMPVDDPAQALFIGYEPSHSIAGAGAAYTYTDTVPHPGVWWYRLQELGSIGVMAFSQPVSPVVMNTYYFPVVACWPPH